MDEDGLQFQSHVSLEFCRSLLFHFALLFSHLKKKLFPTIVHRVLSLLQSSLDKGNKETFFMSNCVMYSLQDVL